MNSRVIFSLVFVGLGLIIAATPSNTTKAYKLTAEELLEEAYSRNQYISPDEVADLLINKDPAFLLIDVRDQDEYEKYSLPNSINIPLTNLLAEEWEAYLDQDIRLNVFYSNGSLKANEAWMITRQLGYENNYVLEGGLNYWAETIMNPEKPSSTSPNEEFAKYDFRKGASMALGGGALVGSAGGNKPSAKPKIASRPKKKRAAGGC
ncbi:MAG: rhodanese-like domain-containing protein [Bacteroidetes bacterium]|jgi:sulfur-carrier protein adenylyltransferase/sulfurtransferase|nr:rhodanese-like domain-containing protein [Bacteroidota bacterium]MBT3748147.1 rhodanese-like domain-containing protein [Bacteroidota bacterium]MBT4401582.1 rhodanese-like domain-containing protein [Bacteroidota bacterium]MBT4408904.1 rhodanese-like domain-containing protein [Bacteroidota bacterium]MBT7095452.1 rhodanese-like domain-containing protein [Bacteroidota bacterium]